MAPAKLDTAWKKIDKDGYPDPNEHDRVLIYTEGHDFAGAQFFDVNAEHLNPANFESPEDRPEECYVASHWKPLPFPTR